MVVKGGAWVDVWVDGACPGNPGPGGWAALLIYKTKRVMIHGRVNPATNNRMELTAAIEGLKALTTPCRVRIHIDSAYVMDAFAKGWMDRWLNNGWQAKRGDVKNRDLWELLKAEVDRHLEVEWVKVKGHSGDRFNDQVDAAAVLAAGSL